MQSVRTCSSCPTYAELILSYGDNIVEVKQVMIEADPTQNLRFFFLGFSDACFYLFIFNQHIFRLWKRIAPLKSFRPCQECLTLTKKKVFWPEICFVKHKTRSLALKSNGQSVFRVAEWLAWQIKPPKVSIVSRPSWKLYLLDWVLLWLLQETPDEHIERRARHVSVPGSVVPDVTL